MFNDAVRSVSANLAWRLSRSIFPRRFVCACFHLHLHHRQHAFCAITLSIIFAAPPQIFQRRQTAIERINRSISAQAAANGALASGERYAASCSPARRTRAATPHAAASRHQARRSRAGEKDQATIEDIDNDQTNARENLSTICALLTRRRAGRRRIRLVIFLYRRYRPYVKKKKYALRRTPISIVTGIFAWHAALHVPLRRFSHASRRVLFSSAARMRRHIWGDRTHQMDV